MPLLSKEQKNQELVEIKDFLNELEFAAAILPSGPWAEQDSLLVQLPTDKEIDWKSDDLPDNAYIAVGNMLQLDEKDDRQLTKYLMFYFMLPEVVAQGKELEALQIVNEMNQIVRMGSFFFGEGQGAEGVNNYIQYRLTIGTSTEGSFDEGVVGEAIIEMGLYYDIMSDKMEALLK